MLNAFECPVEAEFSPTMSESVPILDVEGEVVEVPDVKAYIAATRRTATQPAVNGNPSSEGPSGTGDLDDLVMWLDKMEAKL